MRIKYKKCSSLRIRIEGSKCTVVNLKLLSITSRSVTYLSFLRETLLDSTKEEFNNSVKNVCECILK